MFERLAGAIDELVVPAHGDAIVELRALADRLEAKLADAEAGYDAAGGFEPDGFASMAAFVRHRCRTGLRDSRRVARRAARLRQVPELGESWRSGRLSGTQVELVCALVPERHVARFAAVAGENIELLAPLDATDTGSALRFWVGLADDAEQRDAAALGIDTSPPAPARELTASRVADTLVVRGELSDPDHAATVEAALRAATRADRDGERRSPTERRADALVEICAHFLATATQADGARTAGRLTVLADIDVLYRAALRGAGVTTPAQLDRFLAGRTMGALERGLFLDAFHEPTGTARTLDGNPVGSGLLSTLASGGVLELLLTAKGQPLHLGRSVRTFTDAQRRAVLARDQGCRAPGCDAPPERCHIHHVVPWQAGGPTDVTNAVAKCSFDHHDHHRRRFSDRIDPDGAYSVTTPTGAVLVTHPPRTIRLALRPGDQPVPPPPSAGPTEPARPVATVRALEHALLDHRSPPGLPPSAPSSRGPTQRFCRWATAEHDRTDAAEIAAPPRRSCCPRRHPDLLVDGSAVTVLAGVGGSADLGG